VFRPDNVKVPAPDLVNATEPANIGDTLTDTPVVGLIVNPLVLVNVPLPVIDPSVNVTAPTESEYIPRANIAVEPLTVTAPVEIALSIPYVKLPAETVVRPV